MPDRQVPVPEAAPTVVLDTNVVLDWLVFGNPKVVALGVAVADGRLHWVGTAQTLGELRHVLHQPAMLQWQDTREQALAIAESLCQLMPEPMLPLAGGLRCTDPDDQKFIDLALALPARWLLTRDRALLRLARRARARGVAVCAPWPTPGEPATLRPWVPAAGTIA